MMKKIIIVLGIFFLMDANAENLGFETCLSADKITHVPGQPWEVSADSSAWIVIKSDRYSSLTQLSADMSVERTVEPYHIQSYLADVTCDYGLVVLKRTYVEGGPPFKNATYIGADSNLDSSGNLKASPWNWATSCSTTVGDLGKCMWMFYYFEYIAPILPLNPYPYGWAPA